MILEGKVAIVTGGARGIGRAYVEALANTGAAVMIVDLLEEEGNKTVEALRAKGQKVAFRKVDIASKDDTEAIWRDRCPGKQCRHVRLAQRWPDE